MPPPLYPDPPLLATHLLAVPGGHVLQVQEFGHPDGIPAVVLHGGPGSGCSPLLRRFFDPGRWRIVCPDQRGAGGSRPRGGVEQNTTDDLIADLRRIRERLGVARWLVAGGSWGSTLAVAYAAAEPAAIAALLLRASFLARREDIAWFFQGAARDLPEDWAAFAAAAPADRRHDLLGWLADSLIEGGAEARCRAALAWWRWEQALAGQSGATPPQGEALAFQVDRLRVQAHYLRHGCWLESPTLLERCAAAPPVPTLLIHARDDRVCRAEGAIVLQRRLPGSRIHWVEQAGHDPAHPAMAGATVAALDHYAAHRDFGAAP